MSEKPKTQEKSNEGEKYLKSRKKTGLIAAICFIAAIVGVIVTIVLVAGNPSSSANTITLYDADGQECGTYTEGGADYVPNKKQGYEFLGWADEQGTVYNSLETALASGATSLTQKWDYKKYTVYYYTDGGIISDSEYTYHEAVNSKGAYYTKEITYFTDTFKLPVSSGNTAALIVRSGYEFLGWTNDADHTVYDVKTMTTNDVSFYANWQRVSHSIVVYGPNNSVLTQVSINEGETITLGDYVPTCDGYVFSGKYYTDKACTREYTFGSTMGSNGITLYTKWTANEYTITYYDVNGDVFDTLIYTTDSDITNHPEYSVAAGISFDGWGIDAYGTEISQLEKMPAHNFALYAKTSQIEYTIKWYIGTEYTTETYYYNDEPTYKGTTPVKLSDDYYKYTFAKWKVQGTEADLISGTTKITSNISFYAVFNQTSLNQYTIVFNTNGGTEITAITQDYGTAIVAPSNPTRDGYTFAGWDKTIPSTMPNEDTIITASWTAITYNVTYVLNGGTNAETNPSTYTILSEDITLSNPTKTGYTFDGWTYVGQSEPTKDVTIAQGSINNITYTASWTINQYTITFNTDGGTEITAITQDYGTAIVAPSNPTRDGYTFAGWDKTIPSTMPNEDTIITASWTINQYTITFNTDGGTEIEAITHEYNTAIVAPEDPTKTGYTFAGWDVTVPTTMGAENITITASWTINQYTITFNTDGGTEITAITQDYGTSVVAPEDPTKTGYSFNNWDAAIPSTMGAENITITASWTINQYTITFNTDGGTEITAITQDYGTSVVAPSNPTKTGYSFNSWDVAIPTTMGAENITITASWTIIHYNITYVLDGGTNAGTNPSTYTILSEDITLSNPTKTGYIFDGWTYVGQSEPTEDVTIAQGSINDITYTASWTAKTYTVTYNVNGGNTMAQSTKDVTYDSSYSLSVPTRTGYTFNSWKNESGTPLTDNAGNSLAVWIGLESITIVASWTANTYTVTYNVNGGNTLTPSTKTVTYDSVYGTLATPTKRGYDFAGWKLNSQVVDGSTIVETAGDHELVADWTIHTYHVTYVNTQYDNNFGQVVQTDFTVLDAVVLSTPTAVTNCTFEGWYNAAYSEKITGYGIGVKAEDITVYANWYSTSVGFELNENEYEVNSYVESASETIVYIPKVINGKTVTSIADETFAESTYIATVYMQNVLTIGTNAFENCDALETVKMGAVTNIGTHAFDGCAALATIDMSLVETIEAYAFYNCSSLQSVVIAHVETIGTSAFAGSGLSAISISNSLTSVGKNAFKGISALQIAYTGTESEFNLISVNATGNTAFVYSNVI